MDSASNGKEGPREVVSEELLAPRMKTVAMPKPMHTAESLESH